MGSVYQRKNKLWIRYKGPDGKWTQSTTPLRPGQEKKAKRLLQRVEEKIAAGEELMQDDRGPVTVERYTARWIERRKVQGIVEWKNDKARMEKWVIPFIGGLSLDEVRPRHLVELFDRLRRESPLAPKTIYHVYSNVKALFRDAQLDDLIDGSSPCILTKHQLGPKEDKDPEWRATAIYTRDEAEMLISDDRIPADRQVLYALEIIGMLRHGEAAGLRFRHYDASLEPLGRLVIATSYDTGRTKTKRPRFMPVHPVLAAILAEWKLNGWPKMMGRQPTPDDLVVPLPASHRVKLGTMRTKDHSSKRLVKDLKKLKLRHRRGHDMRRTGISLARTDGARKDILVLCTHNPGKNSVIDSYTTFLWKSLCEEVAKLRISRQKRGEVVQLPLAVCAEETSDSDPKAVDQHTDPKLDVVFATPLATPGGVVELLQGFKGRKPRTGGPELWPDRRPSLTS